jgi:hypothetical protein
MSDNPDSVVQIVPFALRTKPARQLAGVGKTKFFELLNKGVYKSYLDGSLRMVVTKSILDHQQQLAEKHGGTPATKPSKRRDRRRHKT